ncbi:MAG: cation transporter [Oligoflexus sp.]|nr:cation transporter [Pseudopedobacter sp.]
MKTVIIAFAFFSSLWSFGEKTASIKVYGNCGMCKSRIEKSLQIEGITKADWDSKTKLLNLSFDDDKTSLIEIEKRIAGVGHDTQSLKADDAIYNKLPGCCQYDRDAKTKN